MLTQAENTACMINSSLLASAHSNLQAYSCASSKICSETDHNLCLDPYGIASVLSLVHVSVCAGDARVHRPENVPLQQSQLQKQHSPDNSAAASAVAAAITAAAEGSMSSKDVSAQSSPRAVCFQPEQAVGEAQSMRSAGDAGPRVQGPPDDRVPLSVSAVQAVLPASDANSQQQYAAASQP